MRPGWLSAPAVDLTLIVGVTALACCIGGAVYAVPVLFIPLLTLHVWCFSWEHVVATFTKLVGLPDDRRRWRFLVYGLPPLVLGFMLLAGETVGVGVLNTGYFFFQWFHTTRQSWGIAQNYRRAAGGMAWDPSWLSELTVWSIPVAGILHRCSQQPARFLYMDLYLPRVPGVVVAVAGVVAVMLAALFVWTRYLAYRRGELSLGHTLYLGSHAVVFGLAYVAIPDLQAGWLLVNVWHTVQYLVFVWIHNRSRFRSGFRREAAVLSWLSQPGWTRGAVYFAACMLIAMPIFAGVYRLANHLDVWLEGRLVSISLVIALSVNVHHYIVDSIIWKSRAQSKAASSV